jgi:hypothetical protein
MTMADGFVSVSRRIEASAEQLFGLLADSANHPLIDGSGMVREPAPAAGLSRAGDAFVMNMHHAEFGDYQMRNEVVGYEAGRRLAWEPARVAASAEEQEAIGDRPGTGGGTSSPPTAPVPPWSPSRSTAAVPRRTCARPSGTARGGGTP